MFCVNKSFTPRKEISATIIKVDDAYAAFASLLELYNQARQSLKMGIEQPSFVDESAEVGEDFYVGAFSYVSKNAKIGKNVKIYPQVHIGDNVKIGDDCILFAGAKIYADTVIGNRCIIHSGCRNWFRWVWLCTNRRWYLQKDSAGWKRPFMKMM